MAVVVLLFIICFCCYDTQANNLNEKYSDGSPPSSKLLPVSFPSKEDTLAYVDALKHSNFSQWRSLEEVAKKAGGGSCTGAINTSVLTALYLLGLFNLCAASPASCCVPSLAEDRRRRRSLDLKNIEDDPLLTPYALPPLLNSLTQNLSTLSLEQLNELPRVATPNRGKVPVHISVVEQVRKLWDSNPRLLSNIPCTSATEAVRSSFISLSGVASGIILAYSIAQLNNCYPDLQGENGEMNKIWFFPIPKVSASNSKTHLVRSLPPKMPVEGKDERDDDCARASVPMVDGSCEKLLSSRVCSYMQWVLLNVETRLGECFPRLCGDGKIFVEQDQMCHDVNEPGFCPENQRLYITAWGEAVCDCKDGMFFGPDKKCHRIYEQEYCYKGFSLQFHKRLKTLVCQEDQCKEINDLFPQNQLPYVQSEDGSCYQFGSTGPCDIPDQFGFNIDKLEPSCVSLDEAGLLKPQRSYQFSHMTFPSFTDNGFPHFEVSYLILNGSTWELVMRTVGRQKRETSEEFSSDEHQRVIPFIDTREFPQNFIEVTNKFKGLEIGFQNQDRRLMTKKSKRWKIRNLEKPRRDADDARFTELKSKSELVVSDEEKNILFYNGSSMNSQSLGKVLLNGQKFNQEGVHLEMMKSDYVKLGSQAILHVDGKSGNEIKRNKVNSIDKNTFVGSNYNDTDLYNMKINITNEENVQVKTDENGKDIMVKVSKGISNPCKWHISFYSQMPNSSVSYNSTSINILSHPHFSLLHSGNKSTRDESLQGFRNSLTISEKEKFQNKNQMLEEKANQTRPNNDFNQASLERNLKVGLENQISDVEIFDQPMNSVNLSNVNLEMKSKNVTAMQFSKLYEHETSKVEKTADTSNNIVGIIGESTFSDNLRLSSVFGQERNTKQISQKDEIIKVSQHNLESKKSNFTKNKGTRIEYKKKKHHGDIRRSKKKKLKKRLNWKKKKNASTRKKISSRNKRLEDGKRIGKTKSIKFYSQKDSRNKNRFQNQSLPEYLRNRGRRQAGPKRRSKLIPGIINAPLLNQCRPGAKRDYNGHCRNKVIPEEKNPVIRRHAKAKYYEPIPPRIKCNEGKRLDSRGVCRATFSGLG